MSETDKERIAKLEARQDSSERRHDQADKRWWWVLTGVGAALLSQVSDLLAKIGGGQ